MRYLLLITSILLISLSVQAQQQPNGNKLLENVKFTGAKALQKN